MITPEEIKEIRKLCDGVSSGPWTFDEDQMVYDASGDGIVSMTRRPLRAYFEFGSGEFIAAARTLVPRLLDEVERCKDFEPRLTEALKLIFQLKGACVDYREEVDQLRAQLAAAMKVVEIARGVSGSLGKESVFADAIAAFDELNK